MREFGQHHALNNHRYNQSELDNYQSEMKGRSMINQTSSTPNRKTDSKTKGKALIKKKRMDKSVSPQEIPANPHVFDEHSYRSPHIIR